MQFPVYSQLFGNSEQSENSQEATQLLHDLQQLQEQ